ncbi:MAG: hypothetical protein H6R35_238 [Bacteroidetes bacterium]|nr:hypothetical protein [Bacteroidota bacterium]
MKRLFFAAVLMIAFCTASFAGKVVAEGKTFTALGDYTIETADNPALVKGEECKTYIISYENTPMKVTVAVCKDRKCKTYVVLSDKLSVQYVCNESYFGVEKLNKAFEKDGYKTSDTELNRSEYFHQKVIAPGKRGEVEATQLIAAYFPMLLNPATEAIASR